MVFFAVDMIDELESRGVNNVLSQSLVQIPNVT